MESGLTAEAFSQLLSTLGASDDQAGERYEDLRRTLIRFFEWRSGPFPEELADETLTRVARKLTEGIKIRNIGSYCYEVARFVLLEAQKGKDSKRVPLDSEQFRSPNNTTEEADEKQLRLGCLDDCLKLLPQESRELILSYYNYDRSGQIDRRKTLAEKLGVKREALANRAQRLRDKLQHCVTACVRKKLAI